jgi:perosamine synthetase
VTHAGRLAIDGGTPVRQKLLPYGRHVVDDTDIRAVAETLKSDWLTTGPKVAELEQALCAVTRAKHAVAVNSGTAALHAMIASLNLEQDDEVIVPAITFAATANAVLYCGARPVFADVDGDALLIEPASVERAVTRRTRAVVGVDYAGQAADYASLEAIARPRGIRVLADACHALGGTQGGKPVGSLVEMSTFSFHPVKHVAAGEGGAIVCDDESLARSMRTFRNHGITTDHARRAVASTWQYEMQTLGFNYRMPDINCTLAISQLRRLPQNVQRRQQIARTYDATFSAMDGIWPLKTNPGASHAYHLYVIRIEPGRFTADRAKFFAALRAENIGVNVHYLPVPWHPYYQRLGYEKGGWPNAEAAYEQIITLPMWAGMTDRDVSSVVEAVEKVVSTYRR